MGTYWITSLSPLRRAVSTIRWGGSSCPLCGGWGELRTGSKRPEFSKLPCSRCNGTGHVVGPPPAPQAVQGAPEAAQASPPAYVFPPNQGTDPWDRPAGHPHFGIHPKDIYV